MTISVGSMQLEQPEPLDDLETYFTGTMPSGGYWTILSRLSGHDHSGGLLGAPVAVSIPDGSITAADLDPSVLAPYALVDGSKPFTGQVTLQADAVVRDALLFGEQGTALAPDVTLSRPTAGMLTVTHPVGGALRLTTPGGSGNPVTLRHDGTYGLLQADAGVGYDWMVAGTPRLALRANGTLLASPDAGQAALQSVGGNLGLASPSPYSVTVAPGGGFFHPLSTNSTGLGHTDFKWTVVYAVAGTINTSAADMKEGITPLDPAACYQAAKDVRWYAYAYLPPAYIPPEPPPEIAYAAADDNETKAEKKAKRDEAEAQAEGAYARMLVETAPARNQRGFVYPAGASAKDEAGGTLPPVPDLFGLSDRESTTPQADLATLGCALQEVIRRLEALEGVAG